MRVLAVDTSSAVASAAILEDEKLVAEYILNHKKTHSQKIMPIIADIISSSGLTVNDIDIFAAANGPGSFTGLRIGAATIKALAHAAGKPLVEVCTLEGIAYNALYSDMLLCPVMDARRNQIYNAVYRSTGEDIEEIIAPRAVSLDECLCELAGNRVLFLGDGVAVHHDRIAEVMGNDAFFARAPFLNQRAGSVAQIAYKRALEGKTVSYIDFKLMYLRKSQAEREREEMIKKGEMTTC